MACQTLGDGLSNVSVNFSSIDRSQCLIHICWGHSLSVEWKVKQIVTAARCNGNVVVCLVQDVNDDDDDDGEEEHSSAVKAGDANLDELEQMLREKALKSLKEAKQLLADDDDKWLTLLSVVALYWNWLLVAACHYATDSLFMAWTAVLFSWCSLNSEI